MQLRRDFNCPKASPDFPAATAHCSAPASARRSSTIRATEHFVDGLRVHGRGFLAAGSVLRLGTPGIELPLIALGASGT